MCSITKKTATDTKTLTFEENEPINKLELDTNSKITDVLMPQTCSRRLTGKFMQVACCVTFLMTPRCLQISYFINQHRETLFQNQIVIRGTMKSRSFLLLDMLIVLMMSCYVHIGVKLLRMPREHMNNSVILSNSLSHMYDNTELGYIII